MTHTKTAVILVAGIGARLRPLTDDRPKALVEVAGETILARAIRLLIAHGVREIVLATGYRDEQIRDSLRAVPAEFQLIPNPDYETTQNSVSLALCEPALRGKRFFKLDGDVLFQQEVLTRLAQSDAALRVAVDSGRALDAEAMKVCLDHTAIRAFGKELPPERAHAETIGIEQVGAAASEKLFDALRAAGAAGRKHLYYEDVYSELVTSGALRAQAVDVSDLPWSEVDTREDLERAARWLTGPSEAPSA